MKKVSKVVLILSLCFILCFSMLACTDAKVGSNGKSAYDIAVDNGFIGSEQEWLDSLVGQNGKDGVDGVNGSKGEDGKTVTPDNLYEMYRIAVEKDNYTGTYVEFLASLGIDASGVISTPDNKAAINKALLSVVSIKAYKDSNHKSGSAGSGVIYRLDKQNGNATIITNYHVVYVGVQNNIGGVSENILVNLYGEEITSKLIKARYIGGSEYYDIAVIEVTNSDEIKKSNARAVSVETNPTIVGETALAIGNAKDKGISVTQGIVSKIVDEIPLRTASGKPIKRMEVMRIDAQVNSGNSGGGLFNSKGNLIGIVNAKSIEENVDGVNYSIPLDVVLAVANNIIETCNGDETRVFMAKLGISMAPSDSNLVPVAIDGQTYYTIKQTIMIQSVNPESLASRIGLLKDDILVSMSYDNKEIKIDRLNGFAAGLLDMRLDKEFSIKVLRKEATSGEESEVICRGKIQTSDLVIADVDKFQNQ